VVTDELCSLVSEAEEQAIRGRRDDKSLQTNLRILELDPDNIPAHLRAAQIYREQKKEEPAYNHYKRVLELEPKNRLALNATREIRQLSEEFLKETTPPTHIILQPCGSEECQEHYRRTIRDQVEFAVLKNYVSSPLLRPIQQAVSPSDKVMVWGIAPGKDGSGEREWNRIRRGDIAVFVKDKSIFFAGRVLRVLRNPDLGQYLWQAKNPSQVWELLYFLEEGQELSFPLKLLAESGMGRRSDHLLKREVRPITPKALEVLKRFTRLV
jgi:hypothetical protein